MNEKRLARFEALKAFDAPYYERAVMVAGMDEVGRGPLAGNVVAACVVLPRDCDILWVDDSKALSEKRRLMVYEEIMKRALFVGVGEATPEEIDRFNILNATKLAMERAARSCPADVVLVDAVTNIAVPGELASIIHGDAMSYAIAAASIVAKVVRDAQMVKLHGQYPAYDFQHNKGYGTAKHIQALKAYGKTPAHRESFIKNFV